MAHVFVALCDNEHQGIVPVPARLGNGQDPAQNLYWGAAGGVKAFFKRSPSWRLVATVAKPGTDILERVVFKHQSTDTYLVADAYDGRAIKTTARNFLRAAAGSAAGHIRLAGLPPLPAGSAASLLAYVGHDVFMDDPLADTAAAADDAKRPVIILACSSREFFGPAVARAGARPLLWTTGLMAPEAYTLEAALEGWIAGEPPRSIRDRAARAYDKYQKCGLKAALRLFATEP